MHSATGALPRNREQGCKAYIDYSIFFITKPEAPVKYARHGFALEPWGLARAISVPRIVSTGRPTHDFFKTIFFFFPLICSTVEPRWSESIGTLAHLHLY